MGVSIAICFNTSLKDTKIMENQLEDFSKKKATPTNGTYLPVNSEKMTVNCKY
jgi:hypothetical protein